MSNSLINAILWPPLWGMGVIGTISRLSRRGGTSSGVGHPLYPWVVWLWTGVLQFCLYALVVPVPKGAIPPAWGSLGNIIAAILWFLWKRRKDIKRKLAALGNKGLARLQSMVRTLRERAKPRPVYRPGWVPV